MSTLFDLPPESAGGGVSHGPLLDDLNPAQRAAVEHQGRPLLIVAGAGSGKTRVLTRRIAYLLAARGVHPGQIMAITFTNKAAAEMRDRVVDLVGGRAGAMWVSTFHSMCVRLLRREAKTLELTSNFSIYDADDSRRLMALVGRDLELDPKRYSARALANHVSNLKNELIDPDAAADAAANDFERRAAEAYREYQNRLAQANALDFDDLIARTVELFQAFPDVAEHYRRRFRHVLVDEYQDTNHAQYTLIRELVGTGPTESGLPPSELCVVGDADQSIYAFRGATIRNIEEFERDYPDAQHHPAGAELPLDADDPVRGQRRHLPKPRAQGETSVDRRGPGGTHRRLCGRQRTRRGGVRGRGDRRAGRPGRGEVRRRGRVLPHQQPVPGVGGDLHPARPAVSGRRRGAVLRAQGGQGRARVPAGAGQPRGHREPAAHPQRAETRHRRACRGRGGHPRRAGAHLASRRRCATPSRGGSRC